MDCCWHQRRMMEIRCLFMNNMDGRRHKSLKVDIDEHQQCLVTQSHVSVQIPVTWVSTSFWPRQAANSRTNATHHSTQPLATTKHQFLDRALPICYDSVVLRCFGSLGKVHRQHSYPGFTLHRVGHPTLHSDVSMRGDMRDALSASLASTLYGNWLNYVCEFRITVLYFICQHFQFLVAVFGLTLFRGSISSFPATCARRAVSAIQHNKNPGCPPFLLGLDVVGP